MYLVVSYPKSGATWFQFLMYFAHHHSFETTQDIIDFYPPVLNRKQIIQNQKDRAISFVKSHKLPKHTDFKSLKPKAIIYLLRNPYDVLASKINHHINEGSIRLILNVFKTKYLIKELQYEGEKRITSWTRHINEWLLVEPPFPLHIVHYEDLINQPYAEIKKLNDDLVLGLKPQDIERAVINASFKKMKETERREMSNKTKGLFYSHNRRLTSKILKTSFINKGKINHHKEVFSPKLKTLANAIFAPTEKLIKARINEFL